MNPQRNGVRVDLQLYLEIPDKVLEKLSTPGRRLIAADVAQLLLAEAETPSQLVRKLGKYTVETRTNVSSSIQHARNTHLK